ncbi:MAG TPA: hypothetical protein EYN06_05905 [Myxococcales bacterium]|nr:hypothetical protein [Myxococcales bacterium]
MRRLIWILLLLVGVAACGTDKEETILTVTQGDSTTEDQVDSSDAPGLDGKQANNDSDNPINDNGNTVSEDGTRDKETDTPEIKTKVLAITVNQGPAAGDTSTVVITVGFAEDFRNTLPELSFGSTKVTQVEALSHGILKLKSPPGPAGEFVDVTVSQGKQSATLSNAFHYLEKAPENYVRVSINGLLEQPGTPTTMELKVESVGKVYPAALLTHIKVDLVQLPVANPAAIPGNVHLQSNKEISINAKKNDTVSVLLLGKNRDLIKDGVIAQLTYSVPPTDPWTITPLYLKSEAVDGLGNPIPVVVESGWLGVSAGTE